MSLKVLRACEGNLAKMIVISLQYLVPITEKGFEHNSGFCEGAYQD